MQCKYCGLDRYLFTRHDCKAAQRQISHEDDESFITSALYTSMLTNSINTSSDDPTPTTPSWEGGGGTFSGGGASGSWDSGSSSSDSSSSSYDSSSSSSCDSSSSFDSGSAGVIALVFRFTDSDIGLCQLQYGKDV